MRVVAGSAGGRRLKVPPGRDVRPTTDLVRSAIFSMLGERVAGARVLELYAGSGSLGIEALSRGATHATFVESDRRALACIDENLAVVPGSDARVVGRDVFRAIATLAADGERFTLLFADPPYRIDRSELEKLLTESLPILADDALVVLEHPTGAELTPAGLRSTKSRRYGGTSVTIFDIGGR